MTFWSRVPTNLIWADRLYVLYSPSGSTNTGDYTNGFDYFTDAKLVINEYLVVENYPKVWTEFTANVESTRRIALLCYVTDAGIDATNANFIGLDTLSYTVSEPDD